MSALLPKELEVAILLDEIRDAKEISSVFKKAGVIPHFYEDFKSFWHGTLINVPDFCLVDVKRMSDGELVLKRHPNVKNEKMLLGFFYSEESAPLLYSTFEIFNLGFIKRGDNYSGQLKALLRRFNKLKVLTRENNRLEDNNKKLTKQVDLMVGATGEYKEKEHYGQMLKRICLNLEQRRESEDFISACSEVFADWKEINEFACLQLAPSAQKLVSDKCISKKFKEIPPLWLGKANAQGIEFFAQNMANQVALELMGGELVSLMIYGKHQLPDRILVIKSDEPSFLSSFDWELFEKYLSGLHAHFRFRTEKDEKIPQRLINPWELFSLLDAHYRGGQERGAMDEMTLIDVDFSDIVDLLRSKPQWRFYWQDFYRDFVGRFAGQYKLDFKICCMGVEHLGFITEKQYEEELFNSLKSYLVRYSYWRYFEEAELLLARTLKPGLQVIPLSPEVYLRHLEGSEIWQPGVVSNRKSSTATSLTTTL